MIEWLMDQLSNNPRMIAGALIFVTIQVLKRWDGFKWLSQNAGTTGTLYAAVMSALAGTGIHFQIDAGQSEGVYTFTISGLKDQAVHALLDDGVKAFLYSQGFFNSRHIPKQLVGWIGKILKPSQGA